EAAAAARVRDDAGVRAGPEMTLDGEPIENGQTISSDVLAAGEHELIVEAEDDLGNTARHVVTFISVSNTPTFGAMTPETGSKEQPNEVTLGVEVTDPNGRDVTATFYAADPASPDEAYQGTTAEIALNQLDFTGQREVETDALAPGDGKVLRSPAAENTSYQRFDVEVSGGAEEYRVSWSGKVDPARGARLYVWNVADSHWELLQDARGAEGKTALSG